MSIIAELNSFHNWLTLLNWVESNNDIIFIELLYSINRIFLIFDDAFIESIMCWFFIDSSYYQ